MQARLRIAAAMLLPMLFTACTAASSDASTSAEDTKDPKICDISMTDYTCKFGQTARYERGTRFGDVKYEITVGLPVTFKPSKNATTPDNRPLGPVNVYFPVRVKNVADSFVDGNVALSHASNSKQGTEYDGVLEVSDGEISSFGLDAIKSLKPGKTLTIKDGFSMATLDGVKYELAVNGLAGYTIRWER
ncbi:hypothetical protein [Acidipropionibacterium timonense]|uniref:hypothetical protein n=1 Tax=Acidipropionibacterium timonense TaxID=2161818 RepID=UPI00102F765F|nr:hypothetical protein [Acidipropionibacterium timonense]